MERHSATMIFDCRLKVQAERRFEIGSGVHSPGERGFTFAEISVILVVLVLIAAVVMPNVVAFERSRQYKQIEGQLGRLPAEARNEAVKDQSAVRLVIQGDQIVMERVPSDGSLPETVKQVNLGTRMSVSSVQQNGTPTDTGSWQWNVYPDGSSDTAGIEFSADKSTMSLILSKDGSGRWVKGDLPDQSQDQWQAGQLQMRS